MNYAQFQESIRHLNCMNFDDFRRVFGSHMGIYYWNRFTSMTPTQFICYLDSNGMAALYDEFLRHLREPGKPTPPSAA